MEERERERERCMSCGLHPLGSRGGFALEVLSRQKRTERRKEESRMQRNRSLLLHVVVVGYLVQHPTILRLVARWCGCSRELGQVLPLLPGKAPQRLWGPLWPLSPPRLPRRHRHRCLFRCGCEGGRIHLRGTLVVLLLLHSETTRECKIARQQIKLLVSPS